MNETNASAIIRDLPAKPGLPPLVSPITKADKALLQQTVRQARAYSRNYEDSWGYIIQATRYGGVKWYERATGALIFFGRKSDTDLTLVAPSFFAEPAYLAKAVDLMQQTLKAPQTILKNINPEEVSRFTPFGFRSYRDGEGWSQDVRFDDQTYSQQIVDLHTLAEAKGGNYQNLRTALHKKPTLSLRRYQETDHAAVLRLLAKKDGNDEHTPPRFHGMYYVSHAMYPTSDTDKFVITDRDTGELLGFTVTSEISAKATALVAAIFQPGAALASVWGIHQTLLENYHAGFQTANLGGCETAGTHHFMRRTFRPVEQIEKTHLVYRK